MTLPNGGDKKAAAGLPGVVVTTARSIKYEHLLAGISGGVVSTLVLHPLDLLKIRFAVDDGLGKSTRPSYEGLRHALKAIFQQEGLRGLYKGVTPNVAGAGTAWGSYFLVYNSIKTEMQNGDPKKKLDPGQHMIAAAEAGILSLAMTNPIWVVKTRLCLQYSNVQSSGMAKTSYKGMTDALRKIWKYEGITGLYKGFIPGLWGVSHGAIQFMAYEEMKSSYNTFNNRTIDAELGTLEYLTFAALSKLIAALTTYPYQVVRARLQDQHSHYKGAIDCVVKTFRHERLGGFYKGLVPTLTRVVPAAAITFLVYEKMRQWLLADARKQI